jgi:hypothetical protein
MANQIASFITGAQLIVVIDDVIYGFAQSISFSENFSNQPVGGLGDFSYKNQEPLAYSARGSFQIYQHEDLSHNPLLVNNNFNPVNLIVSKTFDITVNQKNGSGKSEIKYVLKDCRLTNYSLSFSPNQLIMPSIDYVCQQVIENDF